MRERVTFTLLSLNIQSLGPSLLLITSVRKIHFFDKENTFDFLGLYKLGPSKRNS